jgi:hypothetical protein
MFQPAKEADKPEILLDSVSFFSQIIGGTSDAVCSSSDSVLYEINRLQQHTKLWRRLLL